MKLTYKKAVEVETVQHPCIECGFDGQLKMWQDRRYDTATITCPKCQNESRGTISWNCDYAEVVEKIWNPDNDVAIEIKKLEKQLAGIPNTVKKIQLRIEELKKKQK